MIEWVYIKTATYLSFTVSVYFYRYIWPARVLLVWWIVGECHARNPQTITFGQNHKRPLHPLSLSLSLPPMKDGRNQLAFPPSFLAILLFVIIHFRSTYFVGKPDRNIFAKRHRVAPVRTMVDVATSRTTLCDSIYRTWLASVMSLSS